MLFYKKFISKKEVSLHLLEKWRHFVSPKTLLCFRVRVTISKLTICHTLQSYL